MPVISIRNRKLLKKGRTVLFQRAASADASVSCGFKRVWLGAALLCAVGSTVPVHAGPPTIPEPPGSTVVPVGENMRLNGSPTSAHSFRSNRSVEQIQEFYRREWRQGSGDLPGFREAEQAPWQIISRIEDVYLLTVQVKRGNGGGSTGYLSVSKLPTKRDQPEIAEFPAMNGSRVLSDTTMEDPGKEGRTMIILNKKSVASNVNYYRNYFEGHGWQARRDRDFAGEAHVFEFTKSHGHVNLVIARNDRETTSIVVNAVNSGF